MVSDPPSFVVIGVVVMSLIVAKDDRGYREVIIVAPCFVQPDQ